MNNLSARSLTAAYILALCVVAVMSFASHWTLNGVLRAHEGAASVVNVSGRQRMFSQRISSLAAQYALGDLNVRADLVTAIDQFEAAHQRLRSGDDALKLPAPTSTRLFDIYFTGSPSLDELVRVYVADARTVAAMKPGDQGSQPALSRLFAAARSPLLTRLNEVVSAHQQTSERQLETLARIQIGSLGVVLITLLAEALGIFRPMVGRIVRYTRELVRMATTDPLTGGLNRRSFTERGLAELERARRYDRATSILMIDIDRFKSINDSYGHSGGDAVLKELVAHLHARIRPSDILGRIGGEEFAIVLAETDLAGAEIAAERIRQDVALLNVPLETASVRFTVSIGAAQFMRQATTLKPAMDRADRALYQAKAAGRNRVVVSAEPSVDGTQDLSPGCSDGLAVERRGTVASAP
ncbi:diguanylate cyclase [Bradyrhizobium sp. Pear76]|uniref:diguanylate cyclase n=1 Tax=Bradyrhizobium oropedii TaxID=1571201 RepID=UPI001E39AFA0|nr:diguanylate cyclase [Bradyrhizobium oropedii]MCC8967292.1 diguanylate cyclase [Bradyrhizobium oropedii]